METEQVAKRPFHETIVNAIRRASTRRELKCLAALIKETDIPQGHVEIIAAWNQRLRMRWMKRWYKDLGVPANLLRQKEEVAKKAKDDEAREAAREAAKETRREIIREHVIRL